MSTYKQTTTKSSGNDECHVSESEVVGYAVFRKIGEDRYSPMKVFLDRSLAVTYMHAQVDFAEGPCEFHIDTIAVVGV